ncbi:MAG: carbohydrate ABC transporter permease [Anaerolineae bacterium]|nr:carbohydrate ABC transporter permease [Anaerolineae bacterium]MDW8098697.1 carbohydrate ABC transporter permease [Anaerolineae bacterium]
MSHLRPQSAQSFRLRPRPAHIVLHAILIVGSGLMLLPFLWMLSTSLKEPSEIFTYPPIWIPRRLAWENYAQAIAAMPFGRFYLNSLIVASSVTLLQLLTSSLAGFAFARLRFRGRNTLFLLYLATLMIPFQVTMIPNFILIRYLRWYDTYQALILPPSFSAFSTFLMRQYLLSIPLDLDEAARVDGASSWRIWWQIILPLSGPVLAALTIFIFLNAWNDFLWPLVVTNSLEMRTLPVGLSTFQGQYNVQWHLLMAGSVIALAPVLAVYIAGQNWFVQGITLSGMGGR